MKVKQVDYDHLAAEYDRRFVPGEFSGTTRVLLEQVEHLNAQRILEVGCGTGHWLKLLATPERSLIGLDYSMCMLA